MKALDELRFGPSRTLNLREQLPTAAEAIRRAEPWIRQHQLRRSNELLIITGRGNHSIGGIPVVKRAIEKLLHSLRRQGVVASHAEHNPGAFVVRLAPLRALTDAAPRRRDRTRAAPAFEFSGLSSETIRLLRELAERSLDAMGVEQDDARIADEMHRHLRVFSSGSRSADEAELQSTILAAVAEYD